MPVVVGPVESELRKRVGYTECAHLDQNFEPVMVGVLILVDQMRKSSLTLHGGSVVVVEAGAHLVEIAGRRVPHDMLAAVAPLRDECVVISLLPRKPGSRRVPQSPLVPQARVHVEYPAPLLLPERHHPVEMAGIDVRVT